MPALLNGIIVTESGLVFGAGRDNQIRAWDSDTGRQLWASRFGGDFVGSPVMYETDGRQYLLVPAASAAGGRGARAAACARRAARLGRVRAAGDRPDADGKEPDRLRAGRFGRRTLHRVRRARRVRGGVSRSRRSGARDGRPSGAGLPPSDCGRARGIPRSHRRGDRAEAAISSTRRRSRRALPPERLAAERARTSRAAAHVRESRARGLVGERAHRPRDSRSHAAAEARHPPHADSDRPGRGVSARATSRWRSRWRAATRPRRWRPDAPSS